MREPTASQIGTRVWSYAGVLKDDGLSYMAYVEQLTFLLFRRGRPTSFRIANQNAADPDIALRALPQACRSSGSPRPSGFAPRS